MWRADLLPPDLKTELCQQPCRASPHPKQNPVNSSDDSRSGPNAPPKFAESAETASYLLAAIVNSCEDAIISKDLNGIVTSWNHAAVRIFGYTADEMIGQPIIRLMTEAYYPEEAEILRRVRAGQRIEHYETKRFRKNGEPVDVSLTISPIRDRTGTIIGSSKIAHDISDRRRSEEARFRLASIVDSAEDAIVSKTLEGIITSWNEAATRMFGYQPGEIIGHSVLRLIPPELHEEEREILRKLRAGERIEHYETERVKKNGERLEVSLTISPIRDGSGKIIGGSKIAHDISGQKQMERMLIQSEKLAASGRMAARIAHEINNPLESVMNLVYLARTSCRDYPEAQEYLKTAEQEIDRVSHIARQTLGYYRDTGKPVEVLLQELIDDVLTVYQSKFSARGISIERCFEGSRAIEVSRGEFVQIFSNLISNSIDAMQNGGCIRIHIAEVFNAGEPSLRVSLQDEGQGIEEENLARVFEPFFTTKGDLGTGIGLWVAKQLVEKRGGQIQVQNNTKLGKSGTTVTIDIPIQFSAPETELLRASA